MTLLHMPLYKKLKQMVNDGAIGKVKMVQVNFGSCKEYDVKNRFFSKELAGGALLEADIRKLKTRLALVTEARKRKEKKLENIKNLPPERIVFGGKKAEKKAEKAPAKEKKSEKKTSKKK